VSAISKVAKRMVNSASLRVSLFLFSLLIKPCSSQELPSPPAGVRAYDTPNDEGGSLTVSWELSLDDTLGSPAFLKYEIYRAGKRDGEYVQVGSAWKGETSYVDREGIEDGVPYYYFVRAVSTAGQADSEVAESGVASPQWFHRRRWNVLVMGAVFTCLLIWYIGRARRGVALFIRKIPGLDAVEEAVGRSTELGRPVLYILGLNPVSDVTTLAALTILGRVANKTAQYDTPLLVPCTDPVVMTAAQEVVKQAYTEAARPDAYNEANINYLTYDQFGYAAGVDGMMLREKPGTVFLQGYFYAESLILAETGHSIGALQIAGTTAVTQLPFFIAACDYTLIGEEMFAASTYLSREPVMLGSLKAEDIAKAITVGLLIGGAILGSVGFLLGKAGIGAASNWFLKVVNWFAVG